LKVAAHLQKQWCTTPAFVRQTTTTPQNVPGDQQHAPISTRTQTEQRSRRMTNNVPKFF